MNPKEKNKKINEKREREGGESETDRKVGWMRERRSEEVRKTQRSLLL